MKKFFKRTLMFFGFIIVATLLIGFLNKPSEEDALEAGFASLEEFIEYKSGGYATKSEFEATGFSDLIEAKQFKSLGYQSIAQFKETGFSDLAEAKDYKSVDFDSMEQFESSGFLNLTEAKEYKDAGYNSKEEFESTGFANFIESKEYKDAGYNSKEEFESTGFANLIESKEYKDAGYNSKEEFESTGFANFIESKEYKDAGYNSKEEFESTGFANFTESKEYKDAGFETKAQFAKTGFINLRQQKALKKYGKSHDEAIASESEISLSRFVECDKAGGSMYKNECQGKQVLWYAKIDRHADDGVYLDVVNKCGIDERYSKAVWSKELSYDFWKENDDSCILVLAEIKSENFRTPTIKVKSVVWSETPDEKRQRVLEAKRLEAERIDQKKKQEKLQRELEERKRKSQLEANKFNPEWLVDEYGIMAGIRCEDYVENLAKNTFRWTDGWLEVKFPRYLVSNDEEPYVITIIGDKIEFQNGFGAWGKVTYFCKYDTKAEEVLYAYAE